MLPLDEAGGALSCAAEGGAQGTGAGALTGGEAALSEPKRDLTRARDVAFGGRLVACAGPAEGATPEAVAFLDFDGVMGASRVWAQNASKRWTCPAAWVDPAMVARLNRLVRRTGAAVVVSSSWRRYLGAEAVAGLLRACGFVGRVAGTTPVMGDDPEKCRAGEIARWLGEHPGVARWVALDDLAIGVEPPRFVRTETLAGLTDADVEDAVAALSAPAEVPAARARLLVVAGARSLAGHAEAEQWLEALVAALQRSAAVVTSDAYGPSAWTERCARRRRLVCETYQWAGTLTRYCGNRWASLGRWLPDGAEMDEPRSGTRKAWLQLRARLMVADAAVGGGELLVMEDAAARDPGCEEMRVLAEAAGVRSTVVAWRGAR